MRFKEAVIEMAKGNFAQDPRGAICRLSESDGFEAWNSDDKKWSTCHMFTTDDYTRDWTLVDDPLIERIGFARAMQEILGGRAAKSCEGEIFWIDQGMIFCKETNGSILNRWDFVKAEVLGLWTIVPIPM